MPTPAGGHLVREHMCSCPQPLGPHLKSFRARRCTQTTPVSHSASMMALYTMASALQPCAFMRS